MRIAVASMMILAVVALGGCCAQQRCKTTSPGTNPRGTATKDCPNAVRCPPCAPAARRAAPTPKKVRRLGRRALWLHARATAQAAIRLSQDVLRRKAPILGSWSSRKKRTKSFDFDGDDVRGSRWVATVEVVTPACMPTPAGTVAQARGRVAKASGAAKTTEQLKLVVLLRRQRRITRRVSGRGPSQADLILGRLLKLPKPPLLAYCLSNGSRRLRSPGRLIKWVRPSPLKKPIAAYGFRIAQLYAEAGDYGQATTWLRKSRGKGPTLRIYRQYIQAWLHFYRGKTAQGVRLLQRAWRAAPGKVPPYAVSAMRRELINFFVKTLKKGSPVAPLKRLLGVKKTAALQADLITLAHRARILGEPAKAAAAWNALLEFKKVRASAGLMHQVFFGLTMNYLALGQTGKAAHRAVPVGEAVTRLLAAKKVGARVGLKSVLNSYLRSLAKLHHLHFNRAGRREDGFAAAVFYGLYLFAQAPRSRLEALEEARQVSDLLLLLVKRYFPLSMPGLPRLLYPPPKARLRFTGNARVPPTVDAHIIRNAVRGRIMAIRACYAQGLNRNRKLAGTVKVKFTILPRGKIAKVGVSAVSLKDPKLNRCIRGVIKQLRIPRAYNSDVALLVTYPLRLKPAKR